MDVREQLSRRYAAGEREFAGIDLTEANLCGINLAGVNLSGAEFMRADLTTANLSGANLRGASFWKANLNAVNLSNAVANSTLFSGANLFAAMLEGADLRGAILEGAILNEARIGGANFENCALGETFICNTNMSALVRQEVVTHRAPSSIDWRSVVRSLYEPRLKVFLQNAGFPELYAERMVYAAKELDPARASSLLLSTFISYGGPDELFAQRLNEALKRRGVTTFFFKDDAPPGERLHRVMRKGVNEHDRTILVCSESSLQRPGLLNELEETLAREARDGGQTHLIAIRLDNYVLTGWAPHNADLAQAVRDRVVADFRDPVTFDDEVGKLFAVLIRPPPIKR